MNPKTGGFDLLGYEDPSLPKSKGSKAFVFRALDAKKYVANGITLRLTGSPKDRKGAALLEGIWMIPSEPSSRFRTAAGLEAELQAGRLSNSSAEAVGRTRLSADAPSTIRLCSK